MTKAKKRPRRAKALRYRRAIARCTWWPTVDHLLGTDGEYLRGEYLREIEEQLEHLRGLRTVLAPPLRTSTRDWLLEHGRMPDGGRFDADLYPHLTAPGGPCDAVDNPRYREVVLCWATRLGKTAFGQCWFAACADQAPAPMLYAGPSETLVRRNMQTKLLPMLLATPRLRDDVPPPHRRSISRIDLSRTGEYGQRTTACSIHTAYSGSVSLLGDMAAKRIHVTEADKWDKSRSDEADTMELVFERAKEFRDAKIYIESTPQIKGHSRIDSLYQTGTRHRFYVPCPVCGEYQVLGLGDAEALAERRPGAGGIIWDKGPGGHSDKDVAYRTARYRCEHCAAELGNHERPRMMRRGIWAGEGQQVHRDGTVTGELPDTTRYSSQLGSYAALTLTFGDIAYKFVDLHQRPGTMQTFFNSWDGTAWSPLAGRVDADDLAARCVLPEWSIATVPREAAFLTAGVDRQGDRWVWAVVAWGRNMRHWLVAWGETDSDAELDARTLDAVYPIVGSAGEDGMRCVRMLVDSGFEANEVYAFCDARHKRRRPDAWCRPYKSFSNLRGAPFRMGERHVEERRRRKQNKRKDLLEANHNFYQEIVQRAVERLRPPQDGSLALPAEAADDFDLLSQLVNETREAKSDQAGYTRLVWVLVDDTVPVDLRDAYRMAMVGADHYARRSWARVFRPVTITTTAPPANRPPEQRPSSGFLKVPDRVRKGKPWIRRSGQ